MTYVFARKFNSAPKHRGVGYGATGDGSESINVAEVDMTRVRIGLGMTLVGTTALALGVLYSVPLAIGGGLMAVAGPFVALSGLGDKFSLTTIDTEGGGV